MASPSQRSQKTPSFKAFEATDSPLLEKEAGADSGGKSGGKSSVFPYTDAKNPYDAETQFHVNYLREKFKDIARPNLFKVMILPPDILESEWGDEANSGLLVLAKATKIPSITVKEYIYQRAGQKLYIPSGEYEHGDATITFYNDSGFILRSMFHRWQRLALHNWEYNIGALPLLALGGQVIIYQYDSELNLTYNVKLINAWPKTISEIELSQENENTFEEFTVDFNYSYPEIYKTPEGK